MTEEEQDALDKAMAETVKNFNQLARQAQVDGRELTTVLGDVRDVLDRLERSRNYPPPGPVFRTTRALAAPPGLSQAVLSAYQEFNKAADAHQRQFKVVKPLAESFIRSMHIFDKLYSVMMNQDQEGDLVRAFLAQDKDRLILIERFLYKYEQSINNFRAAYNELERRDAKCDHAYDHFQSLIKGS